MHNITEIYLGDLRVNFFLSGGNPLSGISHLGKEVDRQMLKYFTFSNIFDYLRQCEENGIDTIVARIDKFVMRTLMQYWDMGGHIKWIGQTAKEYGSMLTNINEALHSGASAVYIHGGTFDRYIEKREYKEILNSIDFCKNASVPIGIASHNPNNLKMVVDQGWNNDFFLMSLHNVGTKDVFDDADRISALETLPYLNKPCLLYKILSAGRKTLEQGFTDVSKYIRPQDGVIVGMCPSCDQQMVKKNAEYIYSLRNSLFVLNK